MERIDPHFTNVAPNYRGLRTTDVEPVLFVQEKLQSLFDVKIADVGCGVGRYDIEFFKYLKNDLYLTCIDYNENMLNELVENLKSWGVKNFSAMRASAESLPLATNTLDVIVTFNAIHHFDFLAFLREVSRTLRKDGHLFIYTRLRCQNERNIWGRFFPQFCERENRLYELDEIARAVKRVPALEISSFECFKYRRVTRLDWLMTQAKHRHYSTFFLYNEPELKEALLEFERNVIRNFSNLDNIVWYNENIILNIKKRKWT